MPRQRKWHTKTTLPSWRQRALEKTRMQEEEEATRRLGVLFDFDGERHPYRDYRLPDGRIVSVDNTAAKDAPTLECELATAPGTPRQFVLATRVDRDYRLPDGREVTLNANTPNGAPDAEAPAPQEEKQMDYDPTKPGSSKPSLENDLAGVLNRYSAENGSNTPDFILAQYLLACLAAFNQASRAREKWYGTELRIGAVREAPAVSPQPENP